MGLQLSGSVQLEGNLLVTGSANSVFENISVTNRITANEINVQFVSSSIIYSSGSNRFGDLITDTQQFTGSVDVSGSVTATTLVRRGGTSSQFLMADGSVNTSVLASGAYLPLTGGTLTGALNGTTADFTGASGAFIAVTATTTDSVGSARLRVSSTGGNINDFSSFSAAHPSRANQAWIGGDGNSLTTVLQAGGTEFLRGASTGEATFSNSVTASAGLINGVTDAFFDLNRSASGNASRVRFQTTGTDEFEIGLKGGVPGFHITNGAATELLTISGSNVGVGTVNPQALLTVSGPNQPLGGSFNTYGNTFISSNESFGINRGGSLSFGGRYFSETTNLATFARIHGKKEDATDGSTAGYLSFETTKEDGALLFEAMRINSLGRVGIGTDSPATLLNLKSSTTTELRLESIGGTYRSFIGFRTDGQKYDLGVNLNDTQDALSINYEGTEAMRITSGRSVLFQKQAANNTDTGVAWNWNDYLGIAHNSADSGDRVMLINRNASDGSLIEFRQGNVTEGDITVSGTTVSYNGGHLSRYSQTESNEIIEGLVKGTVMSNLDQMAEWINPETGEPYENEQLNCMKISDVEGDKNVAGVFVNWQYDSELLTNDMNIAMTGDMIIRIAEGVVVEKGDLLISAGDGTAKPQSDDLIRSNTIAKVISNHVTCTYEDGSYCVPCVLMAC